MLWHQVLPYPDRVDPCRATCSVTLTLFPATIQTAQARPPPIRSQSPLGSRRELHNQSCTQPASPGPARASSIRSCRRRSDSSRRVNQTEPLTEAEISPEPSTLNLASRTHAQVQYGHSWVLPESRPRETDAAAALSPPSITARRPQPANL